MSDHEVRAMVSQVRAELGRLRQSWDYELVRQLMQLFVAQGIKATDLNWFRIGLARRAYGVRRGRNRYCGVALVARDGPQFRRETYGIVVRTTGPFAGKWLFGIDDDGCVLMSRNDLPCTGFNGYEGINLMDEVIISAVSTQRTR